MDENRFWETLLPPPHRLSHLIPNRQHAVLRAFHLSCYSAPKHGSTTPIPTPDTPEKKIITGLIPDVVIEK